MKKDYSTVWGNCLSVIRDNVSAANYETWFTPIKPIKLENNILTIQVPSSFYYEWLEEHYIDILRKAIKWELGSEGRLEYNIIVDSGSPEAKSINLPPSNKKEVINPSIYMPIDINRGQSEDMPNPFIIPGLKKIKINSQLVESYSFENFIEGSCNRLARSAGYAVANQPGKTAFNPLFIYSNVGLGKTHLMHAIGLRVKSQFPEKTVLYVTAEQFVQQFVDSVKSGSTNDFQHFYQMIDVLLVDDIQTIAGKEKTQDIFFHIFNHLHQNGKQLVITSDKPPVDLTGFEQRLLSRFKWGLSADLQVPDYETKVAILKKRIYNDGIEFPEEVIDYMAYSINSNIRELEGALISIIAQASLNKKDITLALAKQMIDKYVKVTTREITIEYIQKVVCDNFGLTPDIINSNSRRREIVQSRQLVMYLAKKYTKLSLATIGQACGNKDHATVLHACKAVNNLIETDKLFKSQVEKIDKKLKI
ncbi:MAG: chromosomal replication initiator protein DnaA [Bacteroidales bacterium]|nr:chromosomal replication initiator protein DnaA [Bacteroidales bacterium]MDD2205093.1 chromosomal replication initiator protein DnaA [Bacteroidales bacterium]MDD3152845.1 chromosomal replication initiator protein DnaA [Bacteroidales bacterium]MDD3914575.1 chromosomal replication initiator protein DnaA [Bacteroidales bacterium]MDD4634480.1 chromosomal replication initiator protein DnaA [Bacteroidales bacterium]